MAQHVEDGLPGFLSAERLPGRGFLGRLELYAGRRPVVRGNYEIYRFRAGQDQLIAYLDERCGATPGCRDEGYVRPAGFDDKNGNLFIEMGARPNGPGQSGQCDDELPNYPPYPNEGGALCSLAGFTTTFEILQTYETTTNDISFRVPYMPEGFQFADHFDTFYGRLSTVGDWSKVEPLQCGYPATVPAVGDYLTVADTLPALKPGEARYYVTAVTHQGETRYGRKSSGGVLTGRDPALLPGCVE